MAYTQILPAEVELMNSSYFGAKTHTGDDAEAAANGLLNGVVAAGID